MTQVGILLFALLVLLSDQSAVSAASYSDEILLGSEICDSLTIGAFYFLNINGWETHVYGHEKNVRHGEVALMGFQDIPPGVDLFLTDKAWSHADQKFVEDDVAGEGILKLRLPAEDDEDGSVGTGNFNGIPAGVPFGVGNDEGVYQYGTNWTDYHVEGTSSSSSSSTAGMNNNTNETYYFDLGGDGDQVFLFCINSNQKERLLAGISYNGPFLNATSVNSMIGNDYGTNRSSAPDYLLDENNNGTLVMPEYGVGNTFLHWQYEGPTGLDFFSLQEAIQNTDSNWLGTNPDGTTSAAAAVVGGLSKLLLPFSATTTTVLFFIFY